MRKARHVFKGAVCLDDRGDVLRVQEVLGFPLAVVVGLRRIDKRIFPLRFGGLPSEMSFELYANQPNPFSDATTIGFSLPEASSATLTVYDQTGRIVYSKSGTWAQGYQSVFIRKDELAASGVLYYRLETPTHSAVRKMVRE